MVDTINRDAGDKLKGFRLQRLRAISLLLEQMEQRNNEQVAVFASTEYLDDVYIKRVSPDGVITYTEGDKNYDKSKKFSFMSKEVTNSLIIFLDNWLNCDMSDKLYYCFYTNVEYTYEKNTKIIKQLAIQLPENPILDYLTTYNFEEAVIECIKKRLIYEYEQQYKNKSENGYIEAIKDFTNNQWKNFLSRISWQFGQYDERELEISLVEMIKNRSFLPNIDITNKEDLVIDLLEKKFSSNEQLNDPIAKHVTSYHMENIMLRVSKDIEEKVDDPVYSIWEKLEPPTDNRSLEEKIYEVNPNYKKRRLGLKARDVAAIKEEYKQLTDIQEGSYRYRIFEACQRRLNELLDEDTPVDVDFWLEQLFDASKKHLEDKSQDYAYAIKSEDAIKSAILELIDSCFLSFDEKGFYNG